VDPAGAIQQYKLRAAFDWITSFIRPTGRKLREATSEAAND
jgi:hypothetical protein